jgi:5-methylcytosine-specific restriction endonuclease McrA
MTVVRQFLKMHDAARESIPAAVRRAVWERDEGRCMWPLDGGGRCGSPHRLELDHLIPWARGSEPTVDGLRVLCRSRNQLAARRTFWARCVERYAGASPGSDG